MSLLEMNVTLLQWSGWLPHLSLIKNLGDMIGNRLGSLLQLTNKAMVHIQTKMQVA